MKRSGLWIDGGMYVLGSMFIFSQGYFSTEEAYKYCSPFTLFWLKWGLGAGAAACAALKGFRSMTFARHAQQEQEKTKEP